MPNIFAGERKQYQGFMMYEFQIDDCDCKIVLPHKPRKDKQWIWKAEFFSAFPKFELEMLERGFYLCYMNVGNTFGCPSAMKHFDVFYREMVGQCGLAKRAVLLGLSRGGLYIYHWGVRNLDKICALYADNPVCDFKSWPGGKGIGLGSSTDWQKLIQDYLFADEKEALAYQENPIDILQPFVAANTPLIHVAATEDQTVPITENTDVLERNYHALGGKNLKVIRHHGDHHPHGLTDPTPVIDYILQNGIGLRNNAD